jgi:hypothetical protein
MSPKRHLCLVSNQPVPSLTAIIDPAMQVQEVLLVVARDRANEARWLGDALLHYGIRTDIHLLQDGYDLFACSQDFQCIAGSHPQGVIANITGGTKIMTIAAWEMFARAEDELYYVDIRHDSITWLRPIRPRSQVADRVKIRPYLTSLGMTILDGDVRNTLISEYERHVFKKKLAALNRLGTAESVTDSVQGGQWFEHFVYDEIVRHIMVDRLIQDVATGFKIYSALSDQKISNELDVMCLRDNTAYLFECKTGKAGVKGEATKAIYKLAQLCDQLAGMRGRGVFATTEILSAAVLERARQLRIDVIQRRDFPDIQMRLKQIFSARHFNVD